MVDVTGVMTLAGDGDGCLILGMVGCSGDDGGRRTSESRGTGVPGTAARCGEPPAAY